LWRRGITGGENGGSVPDIDVLLVEAGLHEMNFTFFIAEAFGQEFSAYVFFSFPIFIFLSVWSWTSSRFKKSKGNNINRFFYAGMGFYSWIFLYILLFTHNGAIIWAWTAHAIELSKPAREEIEEKLKNNHFRAEGIDFSTIAKKLPREKFAYYKVNEYGQIIAVEERFRQMFILTPHLDKENNKIKWECLGGGEAYMPSQCRPSNPERGFLD
jgi:hypothetical protein